MKGVNKKTVLSLALLCSLRLTAFADESPKMRALHEIAVRHVATAHIILDLSRDEEDKELKENLINQVISILPDCFVLYLITDKFSTDGSEIDKKVVTLLLNELTVDQIRSGFAVYLDSEASKNSTFLWPVKGYNIYKFKKDFESFLMLKTEID